MKLADILGRISFITAALVILSGCAALSTVTQRREYKYETTGLFVKPCKEQVETKSQDQDKEKSFFDKFRPSKEEQTREQNTTLNKCNETDLPKMVEAFKSIKQNNPDKGVIGDSIEEVKKKGFTVYLDKEEKIQRPGTEVLYGADALAAVGMPLNPPQLDTPEKIEAYKKYMNSHFAWTFKETSLEAVADRIYINTKNSSVVGPEYKFVVAFQNGRVFSWAIRGGPQNVINQENAFLLGPGGFVGDMVTSGANKASNLIIK